MIFYSPLRLGSSWRGTLLILSISVFYVPLRLALWWTNRLNGRKFR